MDEFNLQPGEIIGKIKQLLVDGLLNGQIKLNEDKIVYFDYVRKNCLA